jgi:transcriptional regulator with XRE-family HTH domain
MDIARRLRELREHKEMSQGDIEKKTGLLRCYISRVENGHTVPAIETLEKDSTVLGGPTVGVVVRRQGRAQRSCGRWCERLGFQWARFSSV